MATAARIPSSCPLRGGKAGAQRWRVVAGPAASGPWATKPKLYVAACCSLDTVVGLACAACERGDADSGFVRYQRTVRCTRLG